jgi:hypothetical protein
MTQNNITDQTNGLAEKLAEEIAYEGNIGSHEAGDYISFDWMETGRGWESSDWPDRVKLKSYILKAFELQTTHLNNRRLYT